MNYKKLLAGLAVSGALFVGSATPAFAGDDDCDNDADVAVAQANACDNDIIDDVNVDLDADANLEE